ncbi:MAG TPA: alpha/beta fold hydrolase [Candidatus Acidoferrales bacterium]|nr:alpha/beta fold hydrolase [Candidatus Acidoferrales bacterium]
MRKLVISAGAVVLLVAILAIPIAAWMGAGALHPLHRPLDKSLVEAADAVLARDSALREDFSVTAQDGTILRGWLAIPASNTNDSPADWVMLLHGSGDNRVGMIGAADFLLQAGYAVTMMDSRAQGESGGEQATFGWRERDDVHAIIDALEPHHRVRHLYALGISMGAGIALQAAAFDPRIEAVVAEAPFASLREASYDYVSFRHGTWLGETILFPAALAGVSAMERAGGFDVDANSPEASVRRRPFPILLIEDGDDDNLPARHVRLIFANATGPKQIWVIPGAAHASGLGADREGYRQHVLQFFAKKGKN